MKRTLLFLIVVLTNSCVNKRDDCLPYTGKLYGMGCGAVAVKVINRDVNSRIYAGANSFEENVIEVLSLPDSLPSGEFYFDFRELQPGDDVRPCLAIYAGASRKVVLTKFFLSTV